MAPEFTKQEVRLLKSTIEGKISWIDKLLEKPDARDPDKLKMWRENLQNLSEKVSGLFPKE